MTRAISVMLWLAFTAITGFAFCIFAWTAANMPPPPDLGWTWTFFMSLAAGATGLGAVAGTIGALEELHK